MVKSSCESKMALSPNAEIRLRWPILAGTTIAMFSGATSLPFATSGMFVKSLEAAFGWHRTAISLGPALFMLGVAATTPIVGALTKRFNVRKLIATGMLAVVLCFVLLSQVRGQLWLYYCAYIAMALVGNLSGAAALTAIITRTFDVARGRALGISMAGAGLTTSIGGPVVLLLVHSFGWRVGYLIIGGFVLAMTPVVWILLASEGQTAHNQVASADGMTFRQVLSGPQYWFMMAAFFMVSVGSLGLFVHFVPLLIDRGMPANSAAALASFIGVSTIIARVLTGFLVDRYDARRVAAVAMLLGAGGFFLFLEGGDRFAIFGAIAVGISFGSETDLVGFMIARYFGMRDYGRLFGIMYGVVLSGAFVSPVLYGKAKDAFGSYDPMLAAAACLLVVAAVILTLLPAPKAAIVLDTDLAHQPLMS